MGAETAICTDAFDAALLIQQDLGSVLGCPLFVFTDRKKLFDATTRGKRTAQRHLMIHITAARQANRKMEIRLVGLAAGTDNYVDFLTKMGCNGMLAMTVRSGLNEISVVQWMDRGEVESHNGNGSCGNIEV